VFLLKDLFKKYDPLVIRFFILQSHYRSTLDFTDEALQAASKGLEKLHNTVRNLRLRTMKQGGSHADPQNDSSGSMAVRARLQEAMDDDFNAPQAIAVLFDLSREVNAILAGGGESSGLKLEVADRVFTEFGGSVLGIIPDRFTADGASDSSFE